MTTETSTSSPTISIEVYSDVVCPWCYVGKRRLERALGQLRGSVTAQTIWRPFQLNPTMPQEGMDRTSYLGAKFGGPEAFKRLEERVSAAGKTEDIAFSFDTIARTPNTFLAHRLMWYAARQGRQDPIVERLFKGYFEEGADIGSLPTLVRLAEQAGLQADAFLRSSEGAEDVKADEAIGHRLGIRGVPHFVFDRAYGLSGAQPVEQVVRAIERLQAPAASASPSGGR